MSILISLIVCTGENFEIGYDNDMPWKRGLPADLEYFQRQTMGKPVVMGRKTFDSILASLKKPLPGRKNIVLTRDEIFSYEGVTVIHTTEQLEERDFFVIGGAAVYALFLEKADRIYLTKIQETFEADTYFPSFSADEWILISKETHEKDEKNLYDYDFCVYQRKK